MELRKLLVIAGRFPPAGGVGSFRVTKFVKYLRNFGWEPVVLTVRESDYSAGVWLDRGLEKDIPGGVQVYRTPRVRTRFVNEEGILWLPYLLMHLFRMVRRERPELLFLTGGPFFPLLAGPVARLLWGLPYVIDLRDPWKLARRPVARRSWKAKLEQVLTRLAEPLVLRFAHRVICATGQMVEEYREAYQHLPSERFTLITNGYDPEDFAAVEPVKFPEPTIVYTGKFSTTEAFRDPTPFFVALRVLADRNRPLRFVHVGSKEPKVAERASALGVDHLVECAGARPYHEALAYGKGAAVLLLIGGGQKTEQTGKVFDYLGCQRPVLALAPPDGGIAEALRGQAHARVLDTQDPAVIADTITEMLAWETSPVDRDDRFHRRNLTGQLAAVLGKAISTSFSP